MTRSRDDIYEELLAVRCRRRDAGAWDELVGRYNDRLYYYVRKLIQDEDQSAQLVQEIWLQVLRSLRSLRQPGRLKAWLYAIAHRVVMTHYRKKYASAEQQAVEILDSVDTEQADSIEILANADLVHFGLSRIGWIEREVLTLHFLEDLSTAEIGDVLGVPVGTVKSRLARARRELRSVLEQEAFDTPKGIEQ